MITRNRGTTARIGYSTVLRGRVLHDKRVTRSMSASQESNDSNGLSQNSYVEPVMLPSQSSQSSIDSQATETEETTTTTTLSSLKRKASDGVASTATLFSAKRQRSISAVDKELEEFNAAKAKFKEAIMTILSHDKVTKIEPGLKKRFAGQVILTLACLYRDQPIVRKSLVNKTRRPSRHMDALVKQAFSMSTLLGNDDADKHLRQYCVDNKTSVSQEKDLEYEAQYEVNIKKANHNMLTFVENYYLEDLAIIEKYLLVQRVALINYLADQLNIKFAASLSRNAALTAKKPASNPVTMPQYRRR